MDSAIQGTAMLAQQTPVAPAPQATANAAKADAASK